MHCSGWSGETCTIQRKICSIFMQDVWDLLLISLWCWFDKRFTNRWKKKDSELCLEKHDSLRYSHKCLVDTGVYLHDPTGNRTSCCCQSIIVDLYWRSGKGFRRVVSQGKGQSSQFHVKDIDSFASCNADATLHSYCWNFLSP